MDRLQFLSYCLKKITWEPFCQHPIESEYQLNRSDRIQQLKDAIRDRVLVLDGAMGTSIQARNLTDEDFGGPELDGCNENLVLTRPQIIEDIHKEFIQAGADIIETNTFGGTPLVLAEYDLQDKADEINKVAAELARKAADQSERQIFVAGSIGPTTKAISVTGGVTFDELVQNFKQQAVALANGGCDYFLIETSQDTRNIKAAIIGCKEACSEIGENLPIAVSGTIEPMGTMLAGQSVDALVTSLNHENLLYIGLNCATGPEFMTDHIRTLSQTSPWPVACVPNAGLPDEFGNYLESPDMMGKILINFGNQKWLNLIGGCCGTTPEHIKAFRVVADQIPTRIRFYPRGSQLSGIENLEVTDEKRPLLVGERTNIIGSKKFKNLIVAEKFEEASEVARAQVKSGAHIIDICLANPDRDEMRDTEKFMKEVINKVKVPLMIDSTDAKVIDLALRYCQGKAIINSINLEDGEERFEQVVPLGKKFGAAFVVGTIDEDPVQGMGVTRERKLQIARRSYELLTNKYGVLPEDIYFDPLVFPCATGDEQYVGSARETIEGVRIIKKEFPLCKTVLGISNVSFGLPNAGREVLNSVFLYMCTQAGLDLAIVNSQKLVRYASIPDEDKKLAEDLIFNNGEDPVTTFANHFRNKKSVSNEDRNKLPIEERLSYYIVEGTKEGLCKDLDQIMKTLKPLQIINGPLMKGMDEVGRLFNANELIVAEVLQSAEAMKAAVNHLEPFMEKTEDSSRGKLLLATVKGDVHDIGKNLVDIILSNNGFEVINLGIKVTPEVLIAAAKEHCPDFIGLSGLLVKSAQQMVITAQDLKNAGIELPILVGGAALSQRFVDRQIAPTYTGLVDYASDAMHGLDLAKRLVDEEGIQNYSNEIKSRQTNVPEERKSTKEKFDPGESRCKDIDILTDIPDAPDFDRHILTKTPIEAIWNFINPMMLYSRHLGIKGQYAKAILSGEIKFLKEKDDAARKAYEIYQTVEDLKEEFHSSLYPRAVFQFFKSGSMGNKIFLFDKNGEKKSQIQFPRQMKENGLCLSDYIRPLEESPSDNLALFVVTAGEGIRSLAQSLIKEGRYLASHALQALALETAEAYAEVLHSLIRKMWGFPDPPTMSMMERFQAKYRGKRYSFGYPACPELSDQEKLFELLNPKEIGVQLTDEFMMDPEASVSAVAFHHPQATYFAAHN